MTIQLEQAAQDEPTSDTSQKPVDETAKQRHEPVIDKAAAVRIATALGWEPKREWVGLTDDEVKDIVWNLPFEPSQEHIRAIEAKLKEKNA